MAVIRLPRTRVPVVALLLAALGGAASAESIPEVTLTPSGPDQSLPLGSAFYLKGAIGTEVQDVTPVFVRYARRWWGRAPSFGCSEVGVALGALVESPSLFDIKSGHRRVDEVWQAPASGAPSAATFARIHDAPVLIAGTWTRTAADAKEFKVLVGEPKFFVAGARYCMFVYQRTRKVQQVDAEVRAILDQLSEDLEKCDDKPDPAQAACASALFDASRKKIVALAPKIPATWLDADARKAVEELAANRQKLKTWTADLRALVKTPIAIPGEQHPLYASVASDRLARVLAGMLARDGVLFPARGPKGVVFYDQSGTIEVAHLGVLDNDTGVRISSDPGSKVAKTRKAIPLKLDRLMLPDSTLSALDLLMMARRRVRIGKTYVEIDKLFPEVIAPALRKGEAGGSTLDEVVAAMTAWNALLRYASAPGADLAQRLRAWLATDVFNACATLAGERAGQLCGPDGVFGFAADLNPFEAIRATLTDRRYVTKVYDPLRTTAVAESFTVRSFSQGPLTTQLQMTQKVFFTTYVTPFVGKARLVNTEDDVTVTYGGVQVYFYPNPVDEPMWTNGSDDLRRLVALELAVAPTFDRYGPGLRYGPVNKALPPVMVGLSFQILPYVTASAGRAWLGVSETGLPQEKLQSMGSWYLSLAVQANVPDIVRALASSGSGTGK